MNAWLDDLLLVFRWEEVGWEGDKEIVKMCRVDRTGSKELDEVVDACKGGEGECESLSGWSVRDVP